eukprot:GGOE01013719.1.p2 GENE.GGOE01013719.1~~GGOE01013719.1.p2  ORF type:complete len:192 (-),score=64.92 GGOE01013719.1:173-748(-)
MPGEVVAKNLPELCAAAFKAPHKTRGKRIVARLKLWIAAGKAATGPPISPVFGSAGLKPMEFIKAYNEKTASTFKPGVELRVRVWVYPDKTMNWWILPPRTKWFFMKALDAEMFPGKHSEINRVITPQMCYHIAEFIRPPDSDEDIVSWTRKVAGVARSCAIQVVDFDTPVKTEQIVVKKETEDADDWIFK